MKILLAPPPLEEVMQALEFYRDKPYAADVYLDFNGALIKAQYDNVARYGDRHTGAIWPREDLPEKVKTGFRLLDVNTLEVDPEISGEMFDAVCDIIEQFNTLPKSQVDRLIALRKAGDIDVAGLVFNIITQNTGYFVEQAGKNRVPAAALVFVAEHIARAVIAQWGKFYENQVEVIGHSQGHCPTCGNEPIIAYFENEGGLRMLKCSLCHTCWEFSRAECPFCGHSDPQEGVKFLYYDEADPHRVYLCGSCKRYVKTIDGRRTDRTPVPAADAVGTIYLDQMAMDKGYLRGAIAPPEDSEAN